MKKLFVAMAVAVTALLSSCVQEKSFNDLTPIGENGIAFVLDNTATRSMEATSEAPVVKGVSIPVTTGIQDEEFFLEETIEELNPSLATKGAPAYTVNLGTLYKTMGVYVDPSVGSFGGDAVFNLMDEAMTEDPNGELGWRYNREYEVNPWPADRNQGVDFYLRMPADYGAMDEFDYSTPKSIAFNYSSPRKAEDQKDILFGYTRLTHDQHNDYRSRGGAPVLMSHALTGLKFRSASNNTGALKTVITRIELIGLKGTGHCVITPGANPTVVWSNPGDSPYSFVQEFDNPKYNPDLGADNPDGTVDYISGENNKFGDSWYSAGADTNNPSNLTNLNDEDGSLTFWLVPQVIGDGVKMKVTFRVKTPDTPNGTLIDSDPTKPTEITQTIDLSKYNKGIEWKAGQLRTYTLKPFDVDVEPFKPYAEEGGRVSAAVRDYRELFEAAQFFYRYYQDEKVYGAAITSLAAGVLPAAWGEDVRRIVAHYRRYRGRELVGKSLQIRTLQDRVNRIAQYPDARVLILASTASRSSPTRACSSSARAARARRRSPSRSTTSRRAARSRSTRSTARA